MLKKQNKIKLLIADDHPLVRIGLIAELKRNKDFVIVGEAVDGRDAVKKGAKLKPDIILLDIGLPEINGMEIMPYLSKNLPKIKIIALTMHNNITYIEEMLKLGVDGYVLKDSSPNELEEAIYKVLKGEKYYCSGTKLILKKEAARKQQDQTRGILTAREKQILIHLAGGETNKEIARKLFISVRTVEAHRNRIKNKLNLHTTSDLTRYAISLNLIEMKV